MGSRTFSGTIVSYDMFHEIMWYPHLMGHKRRSSRILLSSGHVSSLVCPFSLDLGRFLPHIFGMGQSRTISPHSLVDGA